MCGPNRRMPINSAHRTRTLAADLAMGIGVSFTACQPAIEFGELEGPVGSGPALDLALVVEDAGGQALAHQLGQQGALQLPHLAGRRKVGRYHRAAAEQEIAALLEVGGEPARECRRGLQAAGREHRARQHIERLTLARERLC